MTQDIQSSDLRTFINEKFNFTVDKFPLFGPDNTPTDQYGLFRSDTGYIAGIKSVSSRYVPHTTDDVCALVEAAAEAWNCPVTPRCYWNSGHYVDIAPSREYRKEVYGSDVVYPRILLSGGYDGKGFVGSLGYYRDMCQNMAIMRQVHGFTTKIVHTSGLRPKMENLIDTMQTLKGGWKALQQRIDHLANIQVNITQLIRNVYAERIPTPQQLALVDAGQPLSKVTRFNNMVRDILARLANERAKLGYVPDEQAVEIVTGWEAYNAIQGWTQHGRQTRKGFDNSFARMLRAAADKYVLKTETEIDRLAIAA